MIKHYIEFRGISKAVVLAKAHTHEKHQHIHFMFSANEYRSQKRLRMSQDEMKKLLWNFEKYQIEKYPELTHSIVHTNKEYQKVRNITQENKNASRENEYQLKLRLGKKLTQKELVSNLAKDLMKEVANFQNLVAKINKTKGLEIYTYRGKFVGFSTRIENIDFLL